MTTTDAGLEDRLVELGKLDKAGLQRAKRAMDASPEPLQRLLPKLGLVSERAMAEGLADYLGFGLAETKDYPEESVVDSDWSVNFLRSAQVVPLMESESVLSVAMADPLDQDTIEALKLRAQKTVDIKVGVPAEVEAALERHFGRSDAVADMADAFGDGQDPDGTGDIERLRDLASEAPVVRIVNRLIMDAAELRASDIHIEPFEQGLTVRYRVDGILKVGETIPPDLHAAMISRLKIMAGLNIAERRLPQDGRIKLTVRGRDIDLRVATMPILHGEAVVLRLLDRDSVQLDFQALGFSRTPLEAFRDGLNQPNGIVLVTGPTGSGKTTTLYTALAEQHSTERKTLTVEDPIEYQLAGINQVQIKPQIGLTFAHVLRAMLRHDPDVIMLGEIRDLETVEIAIQAALTGHLVLSTLHTNNAASTLMRLLDMGVQNYLIASTLNAILAQRLVRHLCAVCREPYRPLPAMLGELGLEDDDGLRLYRQRGCDACDGSGYRGRICVNEVLTMTDAVRQSLLEKTDAATLQRLAIEGGMRTMFQDGLDKVKAGMTTVEEVLRVTRDVA